MDDSQSETQERVGIQMCESRGACACQHETFHEVKPLGPDPRASATFVVPSASVKSLENCGKSFVEASL